MARFIQIVFVWIFWWVQAGIFVADFRMFSELLEIDFRFYIKFHMKFQF